MKKLVALGSFLLFVFISVNLFAIDGVEVFSGFMNGDLNEKEDYEGIPLLVALNFDTEPFLEGMDIDIPGRLDVVVEPFATVVTSPDTNAEVGTNFLLKYTIPIIDKIHLYVKGGAGVLYMSQHTEEQGTQYNFLPQGGGGFHFFINDTTAISCEYRYRHLSNAGIENPNDGIDTELILGGISFFFD